MSTFKFNFNVDNNNCQENNHSEADAASVSEAKENTKLEDVKTPQKVEWLECEEVVANIQLERLDEIAAHARMFTCGFVEIGHVLANEALQKMGDSHLKNAVELPENRNSDLIPGKYEGGLKIWECTYDLIEYLENTKSNVFKLKKVLDLGCGAGILGIYAILNEATGVTFQDYNAEVLECVTIPNVLLNLDDQDREYQIDLCKFYSGDWASFNEKLSGAELFDIILTSETIYNPDNYDKIIDLFVQRLSKDGIVFVAAKTCYFGVGGGTREFEAKVKENVLLNCEVCWKSTGGIQREILKITRNNDLFLID